MASERTNEERAHVIAGAAAASFGYRGDAQDYVRAVALRMIGEAVEAERARLTRELEEARERERALREALVEVAIPLEAFWMVMNDSDLLSAEVREAVQKALGTVHRTVGATTVAQPATAKG